MKKLAQLATALLITMPLAALAQAPALLPVQGILTDTAGAPIDGAVDVIFRIYDAETDGTMLFEETHAGLQVEAGLFTAYLGTFTTLDLGIFGGSLWLGVTVDADPEMPRFLLGTSPYAAFAQVCGDASSLGGLGSADFAPAGHTHDFGSLTAIPADIADGDQDTTYSPGPGINIAGTTIGLDTQAVEAAARNVCFDQESELTQALDNNYASINHTHPAPALDCQTVIQTFALPTGNSLYATSCPAGYQVTGGGVEVSGVTLSMTTTYRSAPDAALQRYRCGVSNTAPTSGTMLCIARCCRVQ